MDEREADEPGVVVGTFLHGYEASLAQGRLAAEGIESEVRDGALIGLVWLYSNAVGGVKLSVRESDAERAREILARFAARQSPAAESEAPASGMPASGELTCPWCG